jgi:hypothetical protein
LLSEDLRLFEVSCSSGAVNRLSAGLDKRRPAIDFPEHDLARSEKRPEQHRCGFRRRQHALRLDPALELQVQPLDGVRRQDDLALSRTGMD